MIDSHETALSLSDNTFALRFNLDLDVLNSNQCIKDPFFFGESEEEDKDDYEMIEELHQNKLRNFSK